MKNRKHQQCKGSQRVSPIIEDDELEMISNIKAEQKRGSVKAYIPKEKAKISDKIKIEDDNMYEQEERKMKQKSVVNTERTTPNNKNVIFSNMKAQNNSLMNQYNKNNIQEEDKKNPLDVLRRPVFGNKESKEHRLHKPKEEIKLHEFNDYSSNDGRAQRLPDTQINKFPQSEG